MAHRNHGVKVLALIVLLSILAVHAAHGEENLPNPYRFQLDNGLTVIIKENHAVPVAALQIWVKAGSIYETEAEAGITHFIEHMIFKGTARYGPGEIARTVESMGGQINAQTSFDYTLYHLVIAGEFFDTGLDVLSDAVLHSAFEPTEIEREKKVVLEEIRMRQDRPSTRLFEEVMAKAYTTTPYRRPVIGSPETVGAISRDSILAYMKRRYVPGNITIAIVGDVSAARCAEHIKRAFSDIGKTGTEHVSLTEPPQTEVRTILMRHEVNESHLALCFPIPPFQHPDTVALDVLAAILGDGESSRLYRKMRDEKSLVHEVSAYAFSPAGPGLFEIACTLDAGNSVATLKAALTEIFRLRYENAKQKELDKAKLNIESGFVYAQQTVEGQARKLGYFESMAGDYREQARYLSKVAAVTTEDIRRVAERYFRPEVLTLGLLVPQKSELPLSAEDVATIAGDMDKAARKVSRPGREASPEPRRFLLSNGITLLVKEERSVPTVSVYAVFLGGLRCEKASNNGLFRVLAELWTKGSRHRGAQEIAAEIESMAGSLSGFSGKNTFGLNGTFLSRFFPRGLEIFREIMLEPAFSSEELKKLRPVLLANLQEQKDSLPATTFVEFNRLLFAGYPYSMNPLGTPETIGKMSDKNIRAAYGRYAMPGNLVLSIVGDVDTEGVKAEIERLFGKWKGTRFEDIKIPPPKPIPHPQTASLTRPKQQVHIAIGFRGVTLYDPDRAPLDVLNTVLSGQGGRLFSELRDKESLAYNLSAFSAVGLEAGAFGAYIATSPEKKNAAMSSLWRELNRVRTERIEDAELDRAKRYIIGTTEIGLQTNASQAMDMALNERYKLGFDYTRRYLAKVDAVSADDVLRVARMCIQADRSVVVMVGPLDSNSPEQNH